MLDWMSWCSASGVLLQSARLHKSISSKADGPTMGGDQTCGFVPKIWLFSVLYGCFCGLLCSQTPMTGLLPSPVPCAFLISWDASGFSWQIS
jgi:hypothetical protein